MKKANCLSVLILLSIFTFNGCKKDPVFPVLTTTVVSGIGTATATSGGDITSDGGAEVTARGVCWGTSAGPTVSGSHTSDGAGTGIFTSSLTGLSPDTEYFIRAFAMNSAGVGYGDEISFATNPLTGATVTTAAVGTYTSTTALMGGEVTADGGATVAERGVCWGITADPTTSGSHLAIGSGTGAFSGNITGLTRGTTYHVRAYAINSVETAYGNDVSFSTAADKATVTTAAVTVFTQTSAVMGGAVTDNGGAEVTERGVCWGTTANPTTTGSHLAIGSGNGAFSNNITGLTAGTVYHVRAYAVNTAGTNYGDDISFTTSAVVMATVTTAAVTSITMTTAVSGGTITSTGGGTVTGRGVCWSTNTNPTISGPHSSDNTGPGTFVNNLNNLTPGTVYYVRAYATNEAGTNYGNQLNFVTVHETGTLNDDDGNTYVTVKIGTQWWMAENLKTTKYNDGSAIPPIVDSEDWRTATTPGYCWYFNDPVTYKDICGAIYNWYAGNTGKLCPDGWRVPSDEDYKALEVYLGMTQAEADEAYWRGTDQGTQMKTVTGWSVEGNGTNTSGFSAFPAGYRYWEDGEFYGQGTIGSWMTSSEHTGNTVIYRNLNSNYTSVWRNSIEKNAGKSVRCIKE